MSYITLGDHNKEVIGCPITIGEYNTLAGKYEQDNKVTIIDNDQEMVNGRAKVSFIVNSTWLAFTIEGRIEIQKRILNLMEQGCINKKDTVLELVHSKLQKSILVLSCSEVVTILDRDILKYLNSRIYKIELDNDQKNIELTFIKNGLWMSLTDDGICYVIEKVHEYIKSGVDIKSGSICELVKTECGSYKVKFSCDMDGDVYISLLLNNDVEKYRKCEKYMI